MAPFIISQSCKDNIHTLYHPSISLHLAGCPSTYTTMPNSFNQIHTTNTKWELNSTLKFLSSIFYQGSINPIFANSITTDIHINPWCHNNIQLLNYTIALKGININAQIELNYQYACSIYHKTEHSSQLAMLITEIQHANNLYTEPMGIRTTISSVTYDITFHYMILHYTPNFTI